MNISRILIRGSDSPRLWKRAYTTVASPAPMAAAAGRKADQCDAEKAMSEKAKSKKAKASRQQEEKKMFDKLKSLTGSYLDRITTEQEKKGFSLTETDLADWANRLSNDEKHEQALEIYEWMEKKKMTFSPSQLAHFVELMGRINGEYGANELFERIDPNFDNMDPRAKNWPAYVKLVELNQENLEKSIVRTLE